ncbi:MAG: hypothetical protein WAT36_11810 [Chromatiaceae bacterium]
MTDRKNQFRKALHFPMIVVGLLLALALVPILTGWVGDIAKDWITGTAPFPSNLWLLALAFALLVLAVLVLVIKGRKLLPPRVLEQSPSFEQRRVVVVLLSPCNNLRQADGGRWVVRDQTGTWISLEDKGLEDLVCKTPDLPQWSWQQTLRAAYYHRTRLERLVLVGSTGAKGSGTKEQLDLAKAFLTTWFPGKVMVYGEPTAPASDYDTRWQADFENLEGLERLLRNILRESRRDTAGFTDADIVIDCTGGLKVASIAAAMVTLDRPQLMFQYVGTGKHAGQVIGFDVSTEHYGA